MPPSAPGAGRGTLVVVTGHLHAPGPPFVGGDDLRRLLREVDDPVGIEQPVGHDRDAAQRRFAGLAARLDDAFGCRCTAEPTQDASAHGRIEVPDAATRSPGRLVLTVSSFGSMVLCSIENPGAHDDRETRELVDGEDARRVRSALAASGYRLVAEDVLHEPYDGPWAALLARPTWWYRYFDHL